MSDFYVEPVDLAVFASQLQGYVAGTHVADGYRADYLKVEQEASGLLLKWLASSMTKLNKTIDDNIQTIREALDGSAKGVDAAAEYYQRTDEAAAAAADAKYYDFPE